MLKLSHVKKTFNKGTVTEKRALTGVDLTLNDGDFVTAAMAPASPRCST